MKPGWLIHYNVIITYLFKKEILPVRTRFLLSNDVTEFLFMKTYV
jgi:hypothetical protein